MLRGLCLRMRTIRRFSPRLSLLISNASMADVNCALVYFCLTLFVENYRWLGEKIKKLMLQWATMITRTNKQKAGFSVRAANNESFCSSSFGGPEVSWVTLRLWDSVTSETNKKTSCSGANRGALRLCRSCAEKLVLVLINTSGPSEDLWVRRRVRRVLIQPETVIFTS